MVYVFLIGTLKTIEECTVFVERVKASERLVEWTENNNINMDITVTDAEIYYEMDEEMDEEYVSYIVDEEHNYCRIIANDIEY